MLYLALFIVVILMAIGALASLVTGIIMTFRRQWNRVLTLGIILALCVGLGIASLIGLVFKAGYDATSFVTREMAAAEAREKARIDAVKALTPGVDFSKIDEQYFQYPGVFDWYRVPVRWPYEMHCIDTLERGFLYRNIAGGKSDDPNKQCKGVDGVLDITHYACDANLLLFRREDRGKINFGVLRLDTDHLELFDTEEQMIERARKNSYRGEGRLFSVKDQYDHFWVK